MGNDAAERRLGGALEPVIGSVYFAPEAHQNYEVLGFSGSPGEVAGVAMPDRVAYATSRGSLLGQVRGTVVAAAFAVFEVDKIASSVEQGWTITDASTICDARERGALAQLERIIGPGPDGLARVVDLLERAVERLDLGARPLAAGAIGSPVLDHPLGRMFRLGDVVREYRGDSHNAAWASAGLSATEIGLLTELFWGLPLRSYSRSRGWSEAEYDTAEERLRSIGALDADGAFTAAGRQMREQIEVATDAQMAPMMRRLGDDIHDLIELLTPWGVAVRAAGGYPRSGPHDIAAAQSAAASAPNGGTTP